MSEQLEAVRKLKGQVLSILAACETTEKALSELEQVQGQINALNAKIPALSEEKDDLESEIVDLKAEKIDLTAERSTILGEIDRARDDREEIIDQRLAKKRAEANKEEAQLNGRLVAIRLGINAEIGSLKETKATLEKEIDALETKWKNLRQEVLGKGAA